MTRILINKSNDILRKKANLYFTEDLPEVSSVETNYENVEWNEALHSLGEKYRLVMLLYYVEGFNTNDISQILNIPDSTVRSRLVRGRKQLADGYEADGRKTL